MSVNTTDNVPSVEADITKKVPLALRFMLDAIDQTANPKTPKRFGDLRNNVLKQVLGTHGVIQWRQKYAAVQEAGTWNSGPNAGKTITHYTTGDTGAHYAENAVKVVVEDAATYWEKAGL